MTSDILISDMHLFGKICRAGILCDTLEKIRRQKSKVQRLIIDGDFLHRNPPVDDPEYFERKARRHPKHARALGLIRSIIEDDGAEGIIIPGNHDSDLASVQQRYPGIIPGRVVPADAGYLWNRGGVQHFAIHGHQGDPSVQRPDADFWLDVYDFIQRFDRADPKASRKIRRLVTRRIWHERARNVPAYVMERALALRARHAYWGHTHVIVENFPLNDVIGHGLGSFAEHPASYIEVTDHGPKLHIVG